MIDVTFHDQEGSAITPDTLAAQRAMYSANRSRRLCSLIFILVMALALACGWLVAYVVPLRLLLEGNLSGKPLQTVMLLVGCEALNFVLMLPIWPLQVSFGFLFGLLHGSLIAVSAYTLCCLPPFLLAPLAVSGLQSLECWRDWRDSPAARDAADPQCCATCASAVWAKVRECVGRHNVVAGVRDAVQEAPLTSTIALRLNLIPPAGGTSYALGAIRVVPLWAYLLGSAVGNMPNAIAYVYLGTILTSVNDVLRGRVPFSPLSTALLTLGLMTSFTLLYFLSRAAASRLERTAARCGGGSVQREGKDASSYKPMV